MNDSLASIKRRGWTLIEVVVVMTIIGMLTALSLVALSHAREAQRKLTCQSRLKQLAIATNSFVSAQGHLPEGSEQAAGSPSGHVSCLARLLPYVEQHVLAERVSHGRLINYTPDVPAFGPAVAFVELYNCPSDPVGKGNSFRACTGSNHISSDAPWLGTAKGGDGAFPRVRRLRLADITDGLTHTVAFSEKRKSNTHRNNFDRSTDVWLSGIVYLVDPHESSTAEIVHLCSLTPDQPNSYYGNAGYTWLFAGYFCTQYNHTIGPNPPMVDCALHSTSNIEGTFGVFPATSYHPDGVNVVMLDGSVHFMIDDVDVEVWRAIATRNGGEVASF